MSPRERRAAKRRATWSAEVVPAGQSKGRLYDSLTPEERVLALAELNARVHHATGALPLEPRPRKDWPYEIFEIEHRG